MNQLLTRASPKEKADGRWRDVRRNFLQTYPLRLQAPTLLSSEGEGVGVQAPSKERDLLPSALVAQRLLPSFDGGVVILRFFHR